MPREVGTTGNIYDTPDIIAMEGLRWLKQGVIIPSLANRTFAKYFEGKIGDRISVKRPWKVKASDGRVLNNISPLVDDTIDIVVDQRKHVALRTSDIDHTMNIIDFGNRYIAPIVHELATLYDEAGAEALNELFHSSGVPGEKLSLTHALDLTSQATEIHIPGGASERSLLITPSDLAGITEYLTTLQNPHDVGMAVRDLYKGVFGGWRVYETIHTPRLECANPTGSNTPLVKISSQYVGDKLPTDGWRNAVQKVLNKGQLIKIAGVGQIQPNGSRRATGRDQTFVVTENVSSNASGQATIPIYPPINDGTLTVANPEGGAAIVLDAFQTCTEAASDNAVITVVGEQGKTYTQYVGFHKMCLEYVPVQLRIPKSAAWSARKTDDQTGLSVSYLADLNITNVEETERLDTLFGVKAIYPEVGIRGISAAIS